MQCLPAATSSQDAAGARAGRLNEASIIALARRIAASFTPFHQKYLNHIHRYCHHLLGSREGARDTINLNFGSAFRPLPWNRGRSFRA